MGVCAVGLSAMVLQSSKPMSFNSESWNIDGEPIKLSCRFSSHLFSEISCTHMKSNSFGVGLYYVSLGLLLALLAGNSWAYLATKAIPSLWLIIVMAGCFVPLWLKLSYLNVFKETVTVIKNIGIQIKTTYMSGREVVKFIDHTSIADVIINEAITMHRVIFYLAILHKTDREFKKSSPQLISLFTAVHPRLEAIKPVYHVLRTVLFNENLDQDLIPSMDGIQAGLTS